MPDLRNLSWKIPSASTCGLLDQFEKSCVENIMKSLSLDSNLDVLDIYSKSLRIAAVLLTPSVTRMLNNSRISGIVLQDWTITRVTPVYGDKRDRSNYRPTSVLGSISMIMERNDHSQILSCFIKQNLIIIDQFEFLKDHFTTWCPSYDWWLVWSP